MPDDTLFAPSEEIDTCFRGEHLCVSERLVISPAAGVFWPPDGDAPHADVHLGTCFGTVAAKRVHSSFCGTFMGMLAHPGERVQAGQPIAWLRVAEAA
jgi:[acyl-carrier-protein] S-malonyltransferase